MKINTQHYMKTFSEFQQDCKEAFPGEQPANFVNWTTKEHCGSEALYTAGSGCTTVEYLQTRVWKFYFNGTTGEGLTLKEAIADHETKYRADQDEFDRQQRQARQL